MHITSYAKAAPVAARTASSLVILMAGAALWSACSTSGRPVPAVETTFLDEDLYAAAYADSAQIADSLAAEPEPASDESLLAKILRADPRLASLEELYVHGSSRYAERELELAEQHFFLLKQGLQELGEGVDDSLAVLYISSLDRKLSYFADILAEERFFSDSYAPVSFSLDDAYDSLRVHYGIPTFMLPPPPDPEDGSLDELLAVNNGKVEDWVAYFTGQGRPSMEKWLGRRHRYGGIIESILEEEGLPRELIVLAMIESGLQASIRSRSGAVGWWQFMRSTARNRGLQIDEWVDERRDIELATRAACRHLELMHRMFQDWALALAAYNAGEYRIQRAIGLQGDTDYWQLRLPRETRAYVPKFIAAARIAVAPEDYGFGAVNPDSLRFDHIALDDAYSLDQISKASGISTRALQELNPQLLAGVTPPGRQDYALRVPLGRGEGAMAALAAIPEGERITWRKHRVRSGETLGAIARRYGTSVSGIMALNGITNARRVRAGRLLTIPYPRGVGQDVAMAQDSSSDSHGGYTVRPGDTLGTIARRHGVSTSALRNANNITRDRIYAGQSLVIPGRGGVARAAGPIDESTHERIEYTVRRGDTLHDISRSFGVGLTDLMSWNGMNSRKTIFPGDKLNIWKPRVGTR